MRSQRRQRATLHPVVAAGAVWFLSLPIQVGMVQHVNLSGVWTPIGVALCAAGLGWGFARDPHRVGDVLVLWGLWALTMSGWPGVLFVVCPLALTGCVLRARSRSTTPAQSKPQSE